MSRNEDNELARSCLASAKPGANGWMRAPCLFCVMRGRDQDKRWSWAYEPESGRWHCFRCHAWGRLDGRAGGSKDWRPPKVESEDSPVEPTEWNTLPAGFVRLADTHDTGDPFDTLQSARAFLRERGVSRQVADEADIGATLTGPKKFRNRIIVPVRNPADFSLVGFVARAFSKTERLRYRYPREMPRGSYLFNQAALVRKTSDPVLVVEGVFDALPYWPDACACLGKPTDEQYELMLSAERPVVVCLDGDSWREGMWLAERLRFDGHVAGYVKLPAREDPNDVEPNWLREQALSCIQ